MRDACLHCHGDGCRKCGNTGLYYYGPEPEWQPIETAPDIVISRPLDLVWVVGGEYKAPTLQRKNGDHWRARKESGDADAPTHWQHLVVPEAPQEAKD